MLTDTLWLLEKLDDTSAVSAAAQSLNINPKLAEILHRRGYSTLEQINDFLFPSLSSLNSPFLMKNMSSAVERLKTAVAGREKIGIFSDSDLDGMTALTVFHYMLGRMNIKPFARFTKNSENYGLTRDIIDEFINAGVTLIITADSGTRDVNEIAYAGSRGVDMIVTDHHEPDETIPDAILINPKQKDCPYPFKDLCGASVIFKFCQAFLFSYLPAYNVSFALVSQRDDCIDFRVVKNGIGTDEGRGVRPGDIGARLGVPRNDLTVIFSCREKLVSGMKELLRPYKSMHYRDFINSVKSGRPNQSSAEDHSSMPAGTENIPLDDMNSMMLELFMMPSEKVYDFISMGLGITAIGVIADVMPMVHENRTLVKHGIDFLNQTKHPGIVELKKNSTITSKSVAWEIAPLLNTPGRFGLTELTGKFFLSGDINEIRTSIAEIRRLNEKRKDMVNDIYSREIIRLQKDGADIYRNFTCVVAPDIPEGMAGLIALKISEKNDMPAIVISSGASDGIYKGSGRSAAGIDFFSRIEPLSGNFERIGGHAQAFGFTIRNEKIPAVMRELDSLLEGSLRKNPALRIDTEMEITEINSTTMKDLNMLAPFGKGNEEPVIISRDLSVTGFSRFGDGGKHGRFILGEDPDIRVIGWRQADIMESIFRSGKRIDIVYTVEEREFNNRKYIQLQLIDCAFHE